MGFECAICQEFLDSSADTSAATGTGQCQPCTTSGGGVGETGPQSSSPGTSEGSSNSNSSITKKTEVVATNCGHLFHEGCISEWFKRSSDNECPCCRERCPGGKLLRIYPTRELNQEQELLRSDFAKVTDLNKELKIFNGHLHRGLAKMRSTHEDFKKEVERRQNHSESELTTAKQNHKKLTRILLKAGKQISNLTEDLETSKDDNTELVNQLDKLKRNCCNLGIALRESRKHCKKTKQRLQLEENEHKLTRFNLEEKLDEILVQRQELGLLAKEKDEFLETVAGLKHKFGHFQVKTQLAWMAMEKSFGQLAAFQLEQECEMTDIEMRMEQLDKSLRPNTNDDTVDEDQCLLPRRASSEMIQVMDDLMTRKFQELEAKLIRRNSLIVPPCFKSPATATITGVTDSQESEDGPSPPKIRKRVSVAETGLGLPEAQAPTPIPSEPTVTVPGPDQPEPGAAADLKGSNTGTTTKLLPLAMLKMDLQTSSSSSAGESSDSDSDNSTSNSSSSSSSSSRSRKRVRSSKSRSTSSSSSTSAASSGESDSSDTEEEAGPAVLS